MISIYLPYINRLIIFYYNRIIYIKSLQFDVNQYCVVNNQQKWFSVLTEPFNGNIRMVKINQETSRGTGYSSSTCTQISLGSSDLLNCCVALYMRSYIGFDLQCLANINFTPRQLINYKHNANTFRNLNIAILVFISINVVLEGFIIIMFLYIINKL